MKEYAVIKVLIVDDHELIRVGIRKLLTDVKGIEVIGDAESGEDAIKFVQANKPDVVLMDLQMPGLGGLEATKRVMRIDSNIKVIILTACDEEPFPKRLLQAGAKGYIAKGAQISEIIDGIRKVHNGKSYISSEIAERMALKTIEKSDNNPLEKLSQRELQVMLMITSGEKVPDISEKLCLSSKTVNSYRYRLFEKLKVSSDVELTLLAIRYGLLDKTLIEPEDKED